MEKELLKLLIDEYKSGEIGDGERKFREVGLNFSDAIKNFHDLASISQSIGLRDEFDELVNGTLSDSEAYNTLRLTYESMYADGSKIFPERLEDAVESNSLGLGVIENTPSSSSEETETVNETEELDDEKTQDNDIENSIDSVEKKETLRETMYVLVRMLALRTDFDAIEGLYKDVVETNGGVFEEFYEKAEKIYTESLKTYSNDQIALPDDEVRENVFSLYDSVDRSAETSNEEEKEIQKEQKENDNGYNIFLLTDGDIEELASTGRTLEDGTKELREITTAETFDENYMPAKGGIFSTELFGPMHGQSCKCGACTAETAEDAKAGAFCPECGSEILSSKNRKTNYAVLKSPIPLLMGRNAIIATMLNVSERVIDEMEKSSLNICYTRYKNSEKGFFKAIKNSDYAGNEKEQRYFGPTGIEEALKDLKTKRGFITVNGKKLEVPMAIANAYYNVKKELKALDELRYPVSGTENARKITEMDRIEKANMFALQEKKYTKAVKIYRSIASLLHTRKGRPQDILTHYLLITPPATRPINDRSGFSDFGEKNKVYTDLIRDLLLLRDIKDAGTYDPRQEMVLTAQISKNYKIYDTLMRNDINDKTGLYVGRLAVAKSSEAIRGVITSCDQKEGQKWLRENGIGDIPTKHIIGLPRHAARNMYKRDIKALLRKKGYSTEEILEAFTKKDGIVDAALDEVIVNGGKGQIVKYERQPTISLGGLQAGYVYLTEGKDSIFIHPLSATPMAGDFDGDTILVTKIRGPRARQNAIRMMDRNLTLDSTGELLINLKQESIMGLNEFTSNPEEYKFPYPILIDDNNDLKELGFLKDNKLNANSYVTFHHILEDVTNCTLKVEKNKSISAGTVYAEKQDGTKLIANECVVLKEHDGHIYAVSDFTDSFLAPVNSTLIDKRVVEKDTVVCTPPLMCGTTALIKKMYDKNLITYNEPVMLQKRGDDGVYYERTTAGKVIVSEKLPEGYSIPDGGFTKKNLEEMIQSVIRRDGKDDVARLISDELGSIGFDANTRYGASLTEQDFPTIEPIDNSLLYPRDGEGETEKYERLEKYNALKKAQLGKIEEWVKSYHRSFIKTAIRSGAMKLKDVAGIVDSERTNDYLGESFGLATSSLALGSVGLSGAFNSAQADFTGNKTTDVAPTGWYRNRMAAAMEGMKIEKSDCETSGKTSVVLTEQNASFLDGVALADDLVTKRGEKLAEKGEYFTPSLLKSAVKEKIGEVEIRTALNCSCKGVCEKCLGKAGEEGNLGLNENFGQNAVASLVAPITQMGLDIGKISGKIEKGSDKLFAILTGADLDISNGEMNVMELATKLCTDIHTKIPELPYTYCAMIAKVFCFGFDERNLMPKPLYAIPPNEREKYKGVLISDPTQLQDTASSFLSSDKQLLKLGINAPGKQNIPLVKRDTVYAREQLKELMNKGEKREYNREF